MLGAGFLTLEVAENNTPARGLYDASAEQVGKRSNCCGRCDDSEAAIATGASSRLATRTSNRFARGSHGGSAFDKSKARSQGGR